MSSEKARYHAYPQHSPYVQGDRYELLKEDHKYFIEKLKRTVAPERSYHLCDVGCGNGEMLYQFKKAFPHWTFSGFDLTREFIETGKRFEGLKGANLWQSDLQSAQGEFDIVFCSSVFQIFTEIEQPLAKLLSLCRPGGWLFVDGVFNDVDIEVRLQYCDNTQADTKGSWRTDWNQHSQASLRRFLDGKCASVGFEEVVNDLDIPKNEKKPINRWTFRDKQGRNLTTNGTNLLMRRTLMTVKK